MQAIKPPVRAIEKALTCYEGDVSRLLDGEGNLSLLLSVHIESNYDSSPSSLMPGGMKD
jgi:hypothetical protein